MTKKGRKRSASGASGGRAGGRGYLFQDLCTAWYTARLLDNDQLAPQKVSWELKVPPNSGATELVVDDLTLEWRDGHTLLAQIKESAPGASRWTVLGLIRSGVAGAFWRQWNALPKVHRPVVRLMLLTNADVARIRNLGEAARRALNPSDLLTSENSRQTVFDIKLLADHLGESVKSVRYLAFLKAVDAELLPAGDDFLDRFLPNALPVAADKARSAANEIVRLVSSARQRGQSARRSVNRSELVEALQRAGVAPLAALGGECAIKFVSKGDRAGLFESIAAGPLAVTNALASVPHPALEGVSGRGKRLRLIGNPGTGKSFAVFQLLANLDSADVVLVRSLDRTAFANDLAAMGRRAVGEVAIVIDNLHEQLPTPSARSTIRSLLDEGAVAAVTVVVTHWTSRQSEVEESIPLEQWSRWGFETIRLDDPPREFIAAIAGHVATALAIQIDTDTLSNFVDRIVQLENTPACAVAALVPYRGKNIGQVAGFLPLEVGARDAQWGRLFKELERTQGADCVPVMRVMSLLRLGSDDALEVSAVKAIVQHATGMSDGMFQLAIERLENSRWIRRQGLHLQCHDCLLAPDTVGLETDSQLAPLAEVLADLARLDAIEVGDSTKVRILHGLGALHFRAERYEECLAANEAVLEREPGSVRAGINAAQALFELGRHADALRRLTVLEDIDKASERITRMLFNAHRRAGDRDSAGQLLERFAQRLGTAGSPPPWLVRGLVDVGKQTAAVKLARQGVRIAPDAASNALLAETLWHVGRAKAGQALLTRALSKWPENGELLTCDAMFASVSRRPDSLARAQRALAHHPAEPALYALVALEALGVNLDLARETAALGMRLFPRHPDLLATHGLILAVDEKDTEAMDCLTEAVDNWWTLGDWTKENAALALGRLSVARGDLDQADYWFGRAREARVPEVVCLQMRGSALREAGRVADALDTLSRAVDLDPSSADAWSELARCHAQEGNHEDAIDCFRKLVALVPRSESGWSLLVLGLLTMHRVSEAATAFYESLKHGGGFGWVYSSSLGERLAAAGATAAAVAAFEEAARQGGADDARTGVMHAECLHRLGRYEEGMQVVRAVLALDGEYADAWALLAVFLDRTGDHAGSEAALLDALRATHRTARSTDIAITVLGRLKRFPEAFRLWREARSRGEAANIEQNLWGVLFRYLDDRRDVVGMLELLEYRESCWGPDATTSYNFAVCYGLLGRQEEAVNRYSDAVGRDPLHFNAVAARARRLHQVGRHASLFAPTAVYYAGLPGWLTNAHRAIALKELNHPDLVAAILATAAELPDPPPTGCLTMKQWAEVVDRMGVAATVLERVELERRNASATSAVLHLAALGMKNAAFALGLLREAFALSPERPVLSLDLAQAELWSGNASAAIELACSVTRTSKDTFCLAGAGTVLLLAGEPPLETLTLADRALAVATPSDHGLGQAHLLRAESLNSLERFEEARLASLAAIPLHPGSRPWHALVRSLCGLGQLSEAVEACDESLRVHRPDYELLSLKSGILCSLGRYKECRKVVAQLGAAGPLLVTPLLDLGEALTAGRQYARAVKAFREARKRLGSNPMLERFVERGVCGEVRALRAQGRGAIAMKLLQSMPADSILHGSLWRALVSLHGESAQHASVLNVVNARLEVAPGDKDALLFKAEALWRSGRGGDAAALLVETAWAENELRDALLLAAQVGASDGRIDWALRQLEQAIEVNAKVSDGNVQLFPGILVQVLHGQTPLASTYLPLLAAHVGSACVSGDLRVARRLLAYVAAPGERASSEGLSPSSLTLVNAVLDRARKHMRGTRTASLGTLEALTQPGPLTACEFALTHVAALEWPMPPRRRSESLPSQTGRRSADHARRDSRDARTKPTARKKARIARS